MIKHYDLFAGIGGFSFALDNVFGKQNTNHIFVERDEFCQLVLKKHWPEAEYHSCINEFVTNAKLSRSSGQGIVEQSMHTKTNKNEETNWTNNIHHQTILTGGFPCQPFSQAGRRQGTADDRYLWPAMFESIRLIRPDWVIAENVAGLVTWSEGLVLEQVCSDLESEDYEVQPFIIPACAVNAPHRRDRVWIVANRSSERRNNGADNRQERQILHNENGDAPQNQPERQGRECGVGQNPSITPNSEGGGQWRSESERNNSGKSKKKIGSRNRNDWDKNWVEVATRLCRVDDGLPRRLDRNPRLKALGNAIVPAVAEEIFRALATTQTQ